IAFAEIAPLELCHPAVRVEPDDAFDVAAAEVFPEAVVVARAVEKDILTVRYQDVALELLGVALDHRATKLVGAVGERLRCGFEGLADVLVLRPNRGDGDPALLLACDGVQLGSRLEVSRRPAALEKGVSFVEHSRPDHAAGAVILARGDAFTGKDPPTA